MGNLDFRKPEDQEKFNNLSAEEKAEIVNDAHGDAHEADDVLSMEIEYPYKWVDDDGLVHGAKTKEEAQEQKEVYREAKRDR